MEISAGARIDRYLLVEPLGEGGQGSVWKAVDALDASRVVALKLVSIAQTKPTHLERVRREARALAKLEHPSLVRCHGLFEDFKASVLGLVLAFGRRGAGRQLPHFELPRIGRKR